MYNSWISLHLWFLSIDIVVNYNFCYIIINSLIDALISNDEQSVVYLKSDKNIQVAMAANLINASKASSIKSMAQIFI